MQAALPSGVEAIVPGLYRLRCPVDAVFVYAYVVVGEQALVVDSGVRGTAGRITALLEQLGIDPNRLSWLVNTHSHWDHMGDNAALRALGVPVAAHARARPGLQDPAAAFAARLARFAVAGPELEPGRRLFEQHCGPGTPVDRCLGEGEIIALGAGVTLQVLETPGHSADGISLFWREQGALIYGDALVGGGYGPLPPLYDDIDAYLHTVRRLRGLGARVAVGGHAGPFSQRGLPRYLDRCEKIVADYHARVRRLAGAHPGSADDPARIVAIAKDLCREMARPFSLHALVTVAAHLLRPHGAARL